MQLVHVRNRSVMNSKRMTRGGPQSESESKPCERTCLSHWFGCEVFTEGLRS